MSTRATPSSILIWTVFLRRALRPHLVLDGGLAQFDGVPGHAHSLPVSARKSPLDSTRAGFVYNGADLGTCNNRRKIHDYRLFVRDYWQPPVDEFAVSPNIDRDNVTDLDWQAMFDELGLASRRRSEQGA